MWLLAPLGPNPRFFLICMGIHIKESMGISSKLERGPKYFSRPAHALTLFKGIQMWTAERSLKEQHLPEHLDPLLPFRLSYCAICARGAVGSLNLRPGIWGAGNGSGKPGLLTVGGSTSIVGILGCVRSLYTQGSPSGTKCKFNTRTEVKE